MSLKFNAIVPYMFWIPARKSCLLKTCVKNYHITSIIMHNRCNILSRTNITTGKTSNRCNIRHCNRLPYVYDIGEHYG